VAKAMVLSWTFNELFALAEPFANLSFRARRGSSATQL
jgi:hypothetical protein